ncbi:MAG TPA: hypothetical protein VM621_16705 [Luteibacter sp.]|uniref:hypothetical protein n=1 Tax=Luteibacter sp. TaxID=1886636 RepID=UPI002B9EA748|nr:hypothetical protein [Luteibacter sp.]HVI56682.1 hypothetical protein [Luteibacter sp.]
MRAACFHLGLALVWLTGCAPVAVKNSVADADPLRRAVVEDVVLGMADVMAPSVTTLAPAHAPGGAFDNALYAALRAKGYTLAAVGGRGTSFDCVVDSIGGTLYRVNVRVGASTMSRLWVLDGSNAYSGGAWARRE